MKLLIKTEFRRNLRSLILWGAIIIGLSVLMLSMYPLFSDSFANMEELLEIFPEGFLDAFGLGEGGLDMSTPYGWFGTEGYLFVVLLGSSYAAILGSSILSKEEDDKTIEFLLSKPITRNKILLGKAIVILINLVIFNLTLFVFLLLGFSIVADEFSLITILLFCLGSLVLEVVFASIAFFISVFITKSRKVISVSLGLAIGFYFFDVIIKINENLSFLNYISPYEYVNAVRIVQDHTIDSIYLLISLGIVLLSGFGTWYFYNKKDISV